MADFSPYLKILPPAQRRLWPELGQLPRDFVLYGGTALARCIWAIENLRIIFSAAARST